MRERTKETIDLGPLLDLLKEKWSLRLEVSPFEQVCAPG